MEASRWGETGHRRSFLAVAGPLNGSDLASVTPPFHTVPDLGGQRSSSRSIALWKPTAIIFENEQSGSRKRAKRSTDPPCFFFEGHKMNRGIAWWKKKKVNSILAVPDLGGWPTSRSVTSVTINGAGGGSPLRENNRLAERVWFAFRVAVWSFFFLFWALPSTWRRPAYKSGASGRCSANKLSAHRPIHTQPTLTLVCELQNTPKCNCR